MLLSFLCYISQSVAMYNTAFCVELSLKIEFKLLTVDLKNGGKFLVKNLNFKVNGFESIKKISKLNNFQYLTGLSSLVTVQQTQI